MNSQLPPVLKIISAAKHQTPLVTYYCEVEAASDADVCRPKAGKIID